MSSTEALSTELIDLLPELRSAADGMGQYPQAEHDLGALDFPAHAGGAQAFLDQALAIPLPITLPDAPLSIQREHKLRDPLQANPECSWPRWPGALH